MLGEAVCSHNYSSLWEPKGTSAQCMCTRRVSFPAAISPQPSHSSPEKGKRNLSLGFHACTEDLWKMLRDVKATSPEEAGFRTALGNSPTIDAPVPLAGGAGTATHKSGALRKSGRRPQSGDPTVGDRSSRSAGETEPSLCPAAWGQSPCGRRLLYLSLPTALIAVAGGL